MIDSCQDVIINAKSNIKLTAVSNIEPKSTVDIKIHGMNIAGTADLAMTMKGSITAHGGSIAIGAPTVMTGG